jgi:hypothetical protein
MSEPEDAAGPLPDIMGAPLETLGVRVDADGAPPPVPTPHAVLLDAIEEQRVTLTALVDGLVGDGVLTRATLEAARQKILAEEAVDAEVGLIARLLAEGVIEPLRTTLARAERAHRPDPGKEDS